jgi:citrate lyase subunit beta/citryl-CoA lyase/(S)-citramalyl-CoA lyase
VPDDEKEQARDTALQAIAAHKEGRIALRINGMRTAAGLSDVLAVARSAKPAFLFVPMVECATEIEIIREVIGDETGIIPLVESVRGLRAADSIAQSPGVAALMFGGGDFAGELGVELAWEPLLHARSEIVMASASAKIRAIDVPYIDIENDAGLAEECARAKMLGFHAKAAIHPRQIETIYSSMRPSAAELAEARDAIAAFDSGGGAAIRFRGKMLEAPLILRYRQLLSLGETHHA